MSKKRTLRRLDYINYTIHDVALETAGAMDMDIEIKFNMGEHHYSIDVNKKQMEELKDLYKALNKIGSIQRENVHLFQYAQSSLETAANTVNRSASSTTLEEQFKAVNQYAFTWLKQAHDTYMPKDFGAVFEKFIKN